MTSFKTKTRSALSRVKHWLATLSFRTGVVVGILCVVFYIVSFAQMALPIPAALKGVLWVIFFGLAKTAQYSALLILGKEGLRRLGRLWRKSA